MGHVPSDDYEAGNFCATCWAGGEPWAGTNTPKYVQVNFSGITACPIAPAGGPPNGSFRLQQGVFPCEWVYDDGELIIAWRVDFAIFNSILGAFHVPTGDNWFLRAIPGCKTDFPNGIVEGACGGINIGWGGDGVVTWGGDI